MKDYFIRRLLLVPFTLIGITLLVFAIVRLAPGGPVQQALSRLTGGENVSRSRAEAGFSLSPAQVLEIEEKFDRHKSIGRGYLEWLGVLPRDLLTKGKEFKADEKKLVMSIPDTVFEVQVIRDGDDVRFGKVEPEVQAELDDWRVRLLSPEFQARRWRKYSQGSALETPPPYRAVMFKPAHDGLLQGSLGYSSKYQDSVWSMILSRMPVSLYYGGISMVLIYAICLPLGVTKAVRHRTWLDNVSSVMVFTGYAIPGYAWGRC